MSQQVENATIALVAGAALEAYRRVKLDGTGQAVYAGAGEPAIGLTAAKAASGAKVGVRLLNGAGTFKAVASAAITQFALVYGTASGKVDDSSIANPGSGLGIALEAATADNDVIEVMPIPGALGTRYVSGQHTSVAASDTVVTGLASVGGIVATLDSDPVAGAQSVTASIGDQAGAPAAGSVLIKTWKATGAGDTALIAASTFTRKINWIAWGK